METHRVQSWALSIVVLGTTTYDFFNICITLNAIANN